MEDYLNKNKEMICFFLKTLVLLIIIFSLASFINKKEETKEQYSIILSPIAKELNCVIGISEQKYTITSPEGITYSFNAILYTPVKDNKVYFFGTMCNLISIIPSEYKIERGLK